jgi:diguanylate cyclase (GGDEF)-like protein
MLAAANDAPIAPAGSPRLARLVFGRDPRQRRAIKRFLLITQAYVLIWLLLALSILFGYSPPLVWAIVAVGAAGQMGFYAILRGGHTLGLQDPLLCFPQALFGCAVVVLGYALIPFGRGAALQTLFIILVFDLHRLRSRQIALIAVTTVAMLGVLVLAKWRLDPASIDPRQEAMNLSMAVLLVPLLSIVSDKVRRVQMKQRAQKAELDRVLAELKTLSQRDAMTGAINRRHMLDLLHDELKRQRRNHVPFSLAMLDIDYFKRVNDVLGHAVGDTVLRQVAALAGASLRDTDVLARWGGEEFLVLLPASPAEEAGAVIELRRQRVAQHDWSQYAPGLSVTFSAGVGEQVLDESLEQTIERADGALYRAKERGRNRVEQA